VCCACVVAWQVLQHLSSREGEADGEALQAQEDALTMKQDAFDLILKLHPEFAWRRNRMLAVNRRNAK
jgi:hypothetical protein